MQKNGKWDSKRETFLLCVWHAWRCPPITNVHGKVSNPQFENSRVQGGIIFHTLLFIFRIKKLKIDVENPKSTGNYSKLELLLQLLYNKTYSESGKRSDALSMSSSISLWSEFDAIKSEIKVTAWNKNSIELNCRLSNKLLGILDQIL